MGVRCAGCGNGLASGTPQCPRCGARVEAPGVASAAAPARGWGELDLDAPAAAPASAPALDEEGVPPLALDEQALPARRRGPDASAAAASAVPGEGAAPRASWIDSRRARD